MWDRPGTSNLNISHRLSPCDWLGLRRLCPVCRTEASSTMRIYRSWCHSRRHLRRWQTDTAFWYSHCILLGICQNSATRTVRRCSKDAVRPWILMYFLHTSPCLILEYLHHLKHAYQCLKCLVQFWCVRPLACARALEQFKRRQGWRAWFFLAKPWHKLANDFHVPGSTMFGPAYGWCI